MNSMQQLSFIDIWRPGRSLPTKKTLHAIAGRVLALWRQKRLLRRLQICYNPRLFSTIGRAILEKYRIELNPLLLLEHPRQLIPTLIHELAHIAVFDRYGHVPLHGEEFRALMQSLNLSPQATHDLPVRNPWRNRGNQEQKALIKAIQQYSVRLNNTP